MAPGLGPVYFTDENTLGLGKLLRRSGREGVVYPGHDDLPEVPLGTLDLDWMPVIARRDLIVVTRDRRIRTRPAEVRLEREIVKRGPGPWALAMSASGVRPLNLKGR